MHVYIYCYSSISIKRVVSNWPSGDSRLPSHANVPDADSSPCVLMRTSDAHDATWSGCEQRRRSMINWIQNLSLRARAHLLDRLCENGAKSAMIIPMCFIFSPDPEFLSPCMCKGTDQYPGEIAHIGNNNPHVFYYFFLFWSEADAWLSSEFSSQCHLTLGSCLLVSSLHIPIGLAEIGYWGDLSHPCIFCLPCTNSWSD